MFSSRFLSACLTLACHLFVISMSAEAQTKSEPLPPPSLEIYLLIGQSNMAGRAPVEAEDAGTIPHCFLFNGQDMWEPAANPLNRYSTIRKDIKMQKMNPGYMFARTMLEKRPGISLGLVVNARGGTRIAEWERGTKYYSEAIRRTKLAEKSGTLKGILWHQGEGDKTDAHYLEKLTKLIHDLREDLGNPQLPFVAGQINNLPLINDQISRLPKTVPFTGFASSTGLQAMDQWHFDTASMKLLGKRYADAMLEVQEKLAAIQAQ